MVGVAGFEPTTFRSRSERASRAALHPEIDQFRRNIHRCKQIHGRDDWIRTSDLFHPKEAR